MLMKFIRSNNTTKDLPGNKRMIRMQQRRQAAPISKNANSVVEIIHQKEKNVQHGKKNVWSVKEKIIVRSYVQNPNFAQYVVSRITSQQRHSIVRLSFWPELTLSRANKSTRSCIIQKRYPPRWPLTASQSIFKSRRICQYNITSKATKSSPQIKHFKCEWITRETSRHCSSYSQERKNTTQVLSRIRSCQPSPDTLHRCQNCSTYGSDNSTPSSHASVDGRAADWAIRRCISAWAGKITRNSTPPDATPVISTRRRVETSLKEDLKVELDRLQELGVLASVDELTPWVSGLAIVPNKSGALRICIDLRPLNKVLKRETYQLPILEDILTELSKAKVFSTVDLRSGYWHCALDGNQVSWRHSPHPMAGITGTDSIWSVHIIWNLPKTCKSSPWRTQWRPEYHRRHIDIRGWYNRRGKQRSWYQAESTTESLQGKINCPEQSKAQTSHEGSEIHGPFLYSDGLKIDLNCKGHTWNASPGRRRGSTTSQRFPELYQKVSP